MITNGSHFAATLTALGLDADQTADTTRNATDIVSAVIKAYGTTAGGNIDPARVPPEPVTGLVYGRIQSGKTRAMIASTAMAFDNKFRIAVVMTSNINDLVDQTHMDFSTGLPGLMIFTKDTDLDREVQTAKLHMEKGGGCLLLICSKGKQSLQNISAFLKDVGAAKYPALIFDDEGDQASLDTNTRKRSKSQVSVAPSAINDAIQNKLRGAIPRNVYVSVTGTPQAVLLQSAGSTHRPSFIEMLPPGRSYIGGDTFFAKEEPEENAELIALVDPNEKTQLLNANGPIPDGLRKSILFFLVSAAAAIKNIGVRDKGYSYLCHPSLRNNEQAIAEQRINDFLNEVLTALYGGGNGPLIRELKTQYDELQKTLGAQTPAFNDIKALILQHLPLRKLLVINAKVKRQGIDYGRGLNFLIGGNTLGRGIAIRDLLVTYYVRAARVSQIDTMHQHARMYGYRKITLSYTRVFITRDLYYRFRDIYHSDEDLRAYIDKYKANPATFPIEYQFNLRTTRTGVLDVKKTDTLSPGKQVYPNYITLPQQQASYDKVLGLLRVHLGFTSESEDQMDRRAPTNVVIDPDQAIALIKSIKTKSKNTWRDSTIPDVIRKVAEKFDDEILLRFRTADRRVAAEGFISTGTLSGIEYQEARAGVIPTLWIMAAKTRQGSAVGAGIRFMYPTLVIPDALPALFMFNRGA
jgi:hypothetical protein